MKLTVSNKEAAQMVYDHLCREGRLNPEFKHDCGIPKGEFTFKETTIKRDPDNPGRFKDRTPCGS